MRGTKKFCPAMDLPRISACIKFKFPLLCLISLAHHLNQIWVDNTVRCFMCQNDISSQNLIYGYRVLMSKTESSLDTAKWHRVSSEKFCWDLISSWTMFVSFCQLLILLFSWCSSSCDDHSQKSVHVCSIRMYAHSSQEVNSSCMQMGSLTQYHSNLKAGKFSDRLLMSKNPPHVSWVHIKGVYIPYTIYSCIN